MIGKKQSGKSTVLRNYADREGLLYSQIDCLHHFNFTKLKKVMAGIGAFQMIELLNFEKFKMMYQHVQSKSARDLHEMRFN